MTIQIQSAYDLTALNGVKVLVFGSAGSGKTRLCATAPSPIILSAESGLLTLRKMIKETGRDIHVITITCVQDLYDAYSWFASGQVTNEQYKTICLDSISEIAESILASEKLKVRDMRQAYGAMMEEVAKIVKMFRDLQGFNVYFAAKEELDKDGLTGSFVHMPMMPGNKIGQRLPYEFDEVFYAFTAKDGEGNDYYALKTARDDQVTCLKDRSGYLDAIEFPDLTNIFNKILQTNL